MKLNLNFKVVSLSILLVLATLSLNGQTPTIQWQKTIGGSNYDWCAPGPIKPTNDGGYIVCGQSMSNISGDKTENSKGDRDYWIIKLNNLGAIEWQKTIGGSSSDIPSSIIQTLDGGYIVGGKSSSGISGDKTESSRGNDDYWIVKLSSTGEIQWQKTIGGDNSDKFGQMLQTSDGGYIVGGSSMSNISGEKNENTIRLFAFSRNDDYWIVKLSSTGEIQWQKTIGGIGTDLFSSLQETSDGGFILGGNSYSDISGNKTENSRGNSDYWIVKINNTGVVQWDKTIGGNSLDELSIIHQTSDNGFIIGGTSLSNISGEKTENSRGDRDFWIIKTNNLGVIQWQKTIGGSSFDILYSIESTQDGGYIVCGLSSSDISGEKSEASKGGSDCWVIKIDNTGQIQWQKTIGGSGADAAIYTQEITNNNYIIGGHSDSNISGDKSESSKGLIDCWIIKLEECVPPVFTTPIITPSCSNNGKINLAWTGGTAPYHINWTGAATGNIPSVTTTSTTVTGLATGSYNLTVTDANNCTATTTATVAADNSCRCSDSLQLVALYNSTNGANWTNKWILTQPMTGWYGVTLNANGCVVDISLNQNQLIGTLPNLSISALESLSLYSNQLSGSIPNLNLPNLTFLNLHTNLLSGTIPIFNLPKLKTLDLDRNQLTGTIPNFNFPELEILILIENQLSGSIPIFNFPKLYLLWLAGNQLSGCISNQIKINCPLIGSVNGIIHNNPNLATQSWANYWDNREGACLPCPSVTASISGNSTVCGGSTTLTATTNAVAPTYLWSTGASTQNITVSTSGTYNVTITQSDGCVKSPATPTTVTVNTPPSVNISTIQPTCGQSNGSLTAVVSGGRSPYSYLWQNGATNATINNQTAGNFSVTVTDANSCTALQTTVLTCTPVSLDTTTCRYKDSVALVALYNATNGASWTSAASCGSRDSPWNLNRPMETWYGVYLNAQGCVNRIEIECGLNMDGSLPREIGNLTELTFLRIDNNPKLVGSIPSEIGNLTKLWLLDFKDNNLTGVLPISLIQLNRLSRIWISGNKITGNIPFLTASTLRQINFSNNLLTGFIPNFNISNLQELWLHQNRLSGAIPNFVLPNLLTLSLNQNQLSGCIPQGIKTQCSNIRATGGDINNNSNLATQDWADYWNNGGGSCRDCATVTTAINGDSLVCADGSRNIILTATNNVVAPTYRWSTGDSTQSITVSNPSIYRVTVSQADGCDKSASKTVSFRITGLPSVTTPVFYCQNQTAAPLRATGSSLLWYTTLTGGIGGSTAIVPNTNTVGTTNYYVSQTENGCEGARNVISVTIRSNVIHNLTPSVCGTTYRLPSGRVVTASGTYPDTVRGATMFGCDSIYTINLTLNDSIVRNVSVSINQGQTYALPDNRTVSTAATYRSVLTRVNGCDSIIYTALTLLQNCRFDDSLALIALYNATGGARWTNKWILTNPITTWYGVRTNTEGCVTGLDLDGRVDFIYNGGGNNLVGRIPDSLSLLSSLTYLNLGNNQLGGSIPSSLGNLTNLVMLILYRDGLTDSIPSSLGNLVNLKTLGLGHNQLSGTIPQALGRLSNLDTFALCCNLLRGVIPAELAQLRRMRAFYVQNNQLTGCLPAALRAICSNVTVADLSNNPNLATQNWSEFCNNGAGACSLVDTNSCRHKDSLQLVSLYNATNGDRWLNTIRNDRKWRVPNVPISNWYGVTTNTEGCVIELLLVSDSLRGALPDLQLPNLIKLDLSDNKLTGKIPNFSGLPNLNELDLDYNLLSDTIPNFNRLSKLQYLDLTSNQLTGFIPNFGITTLVGITIRSNPLTDTIPNFNLPNLQVLNLDANKLTGRIPLFQLGKLTLLELGNNKLTGNVPPLNLPNLVWLSCPNNELSGTIPNLSMPNLETLNLTGNQLTDSIPTFSLPKLQFLGLARNKLNGNVPAFNMPFLRSLNLGSNKLSSLPNFNYINTWDYRNSRGTSVYVFHVTNNSLTFKDILPNMPIINAWLDKSTYSVQDSIFKDTTITKNVGETLSINLGIDGALTSNKYVWFKNGIRFDSSNSNTLILRGLQTCDAATYTVEVTNPNAPQLTLYSYDIKVEINGTTPIRTVDTALCNASNFKLPNDSLVSTNGTYRGILKNSRGCDSLIWTTKVTFNSNPNARILGKDTLCFGQTLTLKANGGTAYRWNNNQTADSLVVNTAGVFTVTVTDNNSCTTVLTKNIVQNTPLSIPASQSDITCAGRNDGLININPTGGTPNYTYLWLGQNAFLSNTQNLTNLKKGVYRLTVTDSRGCSVSNNSFTINEPDTLKIGNALINNTSCQQNNGSINITTVTGGNGSNVFSWNNNTTNQNLTNVAAGTYTLTVRDVRGCTATGNYVVGNVGTVKNTPLSISACSGDSVRGRRVAANTTWTERLTSFQNCDSLVNVSVTVTPINIQTTNPSICAGQTYTLPTGTTVNQTGTYRGRLVNTCDSFVVNLMVKPHIFRTIDTTVCIGSTVRFNNQNLTTPQTYTFKLVANNGCEDNVTFILKNYPAIPPTNETKVLCEGGRVQIADGSWVTTTGTYPRILRGSNNCDSSVTTSVVKGEITLPTITKTYCPEETFTLPNSGRIIRTAGNFIDTIRQLNQFGCRSFQPYQISFYQKIAAIDDVYTIENQLDTLLNVLSNDRYPTQLSELTIVKKPNIGTAQITNSDKIRLKIPPGANDVVSFSYRLCHLNCADNCDTATVQITVKRDDGGKVIETAITPNGDGKNDKLDFPQIDLDKYPNNKLQIFNRWGQVIYTAQPYKRDWEGHSRDGKELPEGNYFFILKLNDAKTVWVGSIYLQR